MRGNGRIFRRPNSPFWWIAYYLRSREYRESSHSTDEKKAQRLLKYRMREVGADRIGAQAFVGPSKERVRVRELLDALEADYKLRNQHTKQVVAHLKPIREAFGDRRGVTITEEVIDRYIKVAIAAGKAPATINHSTQILKRAFKLAIRRKVLNSMPTFRVLSELGTVRQGFFEDADFKAVVELLPEHLKDFTRFAYVTGWRKGEISSLRWIDVDREAKSIHLRPESSKTRKGRRMALEGELLSIIERRLASRQTTSRGGTIQLSEYVFHWRGDKIGQIFQTWKKACKCVGLEGKLFHDLRRTAIRNMIRAGVPERVAMQISGHRTRAIFDRYNIVNEQDLREAIQKTETYLESASSQRTIVPFRKPN